jgi:glucosamine-6-phosphate deaminase
VQVLAYRDRESMSRAAAAHAARLIAGAIAAQGRARIVAATAASQLAFLDALASAPEVAWSRVELFHLDEYVGLGAGHPASFRRMLRERLIDPTGIVHCHLLEGDGNPDEVRRRVSARVAAEPIDAAFVGIGENGHLAFNDPPADFHARDPYLEVTLDERSRRQQVGEGWFSRLEDVPRTAISMSIPQILAARELLVIVPDARKAEAVRATLEGDITPDVPASVLRTHPRTTLYVDDAAASRLSAGSRQRYQL